jgi:hypothetical protein
MSTVMPTEEDIINQQQLLATYRRTLTNYLLKRAMFGAAYCPPEVDHGIQDAQNNIQRIKHTLHVWGIPIDQHTNDEPGDIVRVVGERLLQPRGVTPSGNRVLGGHRDPFGKGMGALRDLVEQIPQIRDAAVAFRTLFQAACEQINVLRTYKALHDLLHNLQLLCYEIIERELPRFPDDDRVTANLKQYALKLEGIITDMQEVIEKAPFIKPKTAWINKLILAQADIYQAIQDADIQRLKQATGQIKRVLSLHPAQINTQLNSTVRAMRLPTLVETITYIRDVIAAVAPDGEHMHRCEGVVAALTALNHDLTTLIDDHDQWQVVDSLLRLIEDCSDHEELVSLWFDLKEQATRLYEAISEQWAQALKANAEELERAVNARDAFNIMQHFWSYRSRALNRFYRVDTMLKNLCDKLDRVDGPLAFVVGVLV